MKRYFLLLLTCSFLIQYTSVAQSNSIFIHREVQNAIKNGTRTMDGKPGSKYWQNETSYTIEASFDATTGKLDGKETVFYKNNSPDALYSLILNLYPNLFQNGVERDKKITIEDINEGVKIKKIVIDGKEKKLGSGISQGTIYSLSLQKSLYAGQSVELYIEWEFTMPAKTTIRVGKYGKNTWFVGYWYPQIAVYDDLYGWDDIPYDGLHEFYMPFANYDVKITVPAKQVVWGTGIWQNPEEVLSKKYLERYQKALKSEQIIYIVEKDDVNKKITSSSEQNTWHFKAENVTDFSFATSDHYLWDGVLLLTDKQNNKSTFIQTAYNKNSKDFYEVARLSMESIKYLSDSMPAIPFPYPRMTVFNGGDGMEFPMMVNDRSCMTLSAALNLTSHEIAHTYFPFYMGINQERFSWMDEGWAQFLPAEFQEQQYPYNKQAINSAYNYNYFAGNSYEVPMMIPSFYLKRYEYYVDSYYRPELAYRTLQALLGRELFLKALQEYIHRWNGKYPSPYDFFFTFNDVAGEDLSWFWKPWFFELAYADLAIQDVLKTEDGFEIKIENKGGLPLPLYLTVEYKDGSIEKIAGTVRLWKKGDHIATLKHHTEKQVRQVTLGDERIPDINKRDNKFILE